MTNVAIVPPALAQILPPPNAVEEQDIDKAVIAVSSWKQHTFG